MSAPHSLFQFEFSCAGSDGVAGTVVEARCRHGIGIIPSARLIVTTITPPALGDALVLSFGRLNEEPQPLFKGVVTKHTLRWDKGCPLHILEAHDPAYVLTHGLRIRAFVDTTDSDIIVAIASGNGLKAVIAATPSEQEQMVQYRQSDWDFISDRLRANDRLLWINDATIRELAAADIAKTTHRLGLKDDLLQLSTSLNGTAQWQGSQITAWDSATQAVLTAAASEPAYPDASAVGAAGQNQRVLGQARAQDELTGWADGDLLYNRLQRVTGRLRCYGTAAIAVGDGVQFDENIPVAVTGVLPVTRVEQVYQDAQWQTVLQFGLRPLPTPVAQTVGIEGLLTAKVLKLSDDPKQDERIKVHIPLLHQSDPNQGAWARLALPDAGKERGMVFRPEVDDEVMVGFIAADPRLPVVVGQVHSQANPSPIAAEDDKNDIKGLTTRSKMQWLFDDKDSVMTASTPAGNQWQMSDKDKIVTVTDQHGNKITLESGGITLNSPKDITLSATGKITLSAQQAISLEGLEMKLSAKTTLKAEAKASSELSSSGIVTVKGSLVKIN